MADLSTRYLGLELKNPLVPSSSPLTGELDSARQLEDAGASAIVMPSLFEEVIVAEQDRLDRFLDQQSIGHGEAQSFRPVPDSFKSSEDSYLERIAALKSSLEIPVVASLNGTTDRGWLSHALSLQQAGADALELNIFYVAGDEADTAETVEQRYLDIAGGLLREIQLPVAIKLSPQFSAPLDMVRKLDRAGVRGVSIFNRFYQPDIDLETLEVSPQLSLSTAQEALLRIRWAAMLFGRVDCGIAVTGGFHNATDALKALLAGADVVHLCSVLLQQGPGVIDSLLSEMNGWLEEKEYESLSQLKGSVSQRNAPDPAAYARANYIDVLNNYDTPSGVRH